MSRIRTVALLSAAAVGASPLASPATPAQAATARADLQVAKARLRTSSITEGATVVVRHTVRNAGRKAARATVTRAYLTTNPAGSLAERASVRTNPRIVVGDLRLAGQQTVPKLVAGAKKAMAASSFTVPAGTPAATYSVLVCADDTGLVGESSESDNCRVAATKLTVKADPKTSSLVLQSFSDTYPWLPSEDMNVQVAKAFCTRTTPARSLSLTAALTSARSFLTGKVGAATMTRLDQSRLTATAIDAEKLAGAAVIGRPDKDIAGSPGLALAALLRAHAKEPGNGAHLLNAAGVAVSVGLPNEALAFVDAALTRNFHRTPMALPVAASAQVVRGTALLELGRTAAATAAFGQAHTLAPILSEADAGLAVANACAGKDAVAKRLLRRSRIRTDRPSPVSPTVDPVRPQAALDLSKGEATPLRHLTIPETPAQGVVLDDVYVGIENGFQAEIQSRMDEEQQVQEAQDTGDETRSPAEIVRRDSIAARAYQVLDQPDLAALAQMLHTRIDHMGEAREAFFGGGTGQAGSVFQRISDQAMATCQGSGDADCFENEMKAECRPELSGYHADFSVQLADLETIGNQYVEKLSTRMSAYAANIKSPQTRRLIELAVRASERDVFAEIVQTAQAWTHNEKIWQDYCVTPATDQPDETEPGVPDPNSPDACSAGLNKVSYSFNLGPAAMQVSCESVTQSFDFEALPFLYAFVEVTYDIRSGGLTLVAGSKASGKIGNVVDLGFKSGVYIKSGGRGQIADIGIRVGPSVGVGAGPYSVSAYQNDIDMSFLPSPNTGPGAAG